MLLKKARDGDKPAGKLARPGAQKSGWQSREKRLADAMQNFSPSQIEELQELCLATNIPEPSRDAYRKMGWRNSVSLCEYMLAKLESGWQPSITVDEILLPHNGKLRN